MCRLTTPPFDCVLLLGPFQSWSVDLRHMGKEKRKEMVAGMTVEHHKLLWWFRLLLLQNITLQLLYEPGKQQILLQGPLFEQAKAKGLAAFALHTELRPY